MPFTLPLLDVPSFPNERGKIANPDATPTREYVTLFRDLEVFLERAHAALGETGQTVKTVATLPAAAGRRGVSYMVTDANSVIFWSLAIGGGINIVRVTSDGTDWRIG